ncbi:hypothetical protein [Caballeronia zhejiangensis]|uniref:Uncharacterized protein n=1 Tax=Caballeronia zhejiangensis TaxID=871203 RepID=A0A656Q9N1_9BURK|nr:hypothetical protein [Caballeronia zhejiangensis]KDR25983.1 hypothetical protein BG60_26275 [Caballeronia zhejiangensis]
MTYSSPDQQERDDAAREAAKERAAEIIDLDAVLARMTDKQKELAMDEIRNARPAVVLSAAYERAVNAVADVVLKIRDKDLSGRAAEVEIDIALSGGV